MPDEQYSDRYRISSLGTLILVVGASGAGKDSLINAARKYFSTYDNIIFPRRLITRTDQTGEDHIPITFSDLELLEEKQELFLSWEAHGLCYGIPIYVKDKLENGKLVIINMSRRKIDDVKKVWPNTYIIHIVVDPEILVQRLYGRGRESAASIKKRMARQADLEERHVDHIIDNSGELDAAVEEFILLIKQYLPCSYPNKN